MTKTPGRKTRTDLVVAFFACLTACGPAPAPAPVTDAARPTRRAARVQPGDPASTPRQARVVLEPPGADPVVVDVEVVATGALRRRGLMFRRTLAPSAGMLFVFDRPDVQSFWMHDTYLRLDMIFIGADRRVVGLVENAAPLTDADRAVDAESQYVLEVHGGFAREHGITPGIAVRFEGLPEE